MRTVVTVVILGRSTGAIIIDITGSGSNDRTLYQCRRSPIVIGTIQTRATATSGKQQRVGW
jgi:hypothetical protein